MLELYGGKRELYVRKHSKYSTNRPTWSFAPVDAQGPITQTAATADAVSAAGTLPSPQFDNATGGGPVAGPGTEEDITMHVTGRREKEEVQHNSKEGSEMLYARLSESYLSQTAPEKSVGRRTIYLGESFPLTYIVHEVISPQSGSDTASPAKLQYSVPPDVGDKARNLGYDTRLEPEEIGFLEWRGALSVLEQGVSGRLVRIFFDRVYPAFPIFDRAEFAMLYNSGKLSLLTLQAVYLLAVTLCEEDLIREAGFTDRNAARNSLYKRVKSLYDADYDTDKVAVITALLLISFCWNGSMDEKDMWHWLGAAIGLAQAQGMHRSSDLSIGDRRLWKRIWWSLYVRDRHCAAGLGRPIRIRDEDCDIEPLEECDFEENESPDPAIFGAQTKTHVLFAIHQAKLAVVLGEIVLTKFAVRQPPSIETVHARVTGNLKTWFDGVPQALDHRNADESEEHGFWANILYILYNHHIILLHRPVRNSIISLGKSGERIAFNAAKSITRVIDDLLANEMLRGGQLHIIPSVFAALIMHLIIMRTSDHMQRKLAENHARLCMLSMSELQKSWPVGGWILRLFESLLKNLPAEREPQNSGIDEGDPGLDIKAAKSPCKLSALPSSSHQPLRINSLQYPGTNYITSETNGEGLFPPLPLESSNLLDIYQSDEAMHRENFPQAFFDQSGLQNQNYFSNLSANSMLGNSEFLLYFMNEFPES
ncbi:hypothetical protein B7494_g4221 [Chlorociboria aeruginascens]|nr:hypothetical protein B7494_g4221 [Chlorociboria aeruginascens]